MKMKRNENKLKRGEEKQCATVKRTTRSNDTPFRASIVADFSGAAIL